MYWKWLLSFTSLNAFHLINYPSNTLVVFVKSTFTHNLSCFFFFFSSLSTTHVQLTFSQFLHAFHLSFAYSRHQQYFFLAVQVFYVFVASQSISSVTLSFFFSSMQHSLFLLIVSLDGVKFSSPFNQREWDAVRFLFFFYDLSEVKRKKKSKKNETSRRWEWKRKKVDSILVSYKHRSVCICCVSFLRQSNSPILLSTVNESTQAKKDKLSQVDELNRDKQFKIGNQ